MDSGLFVNGTWTTDSNLSGIPNSLSCIPRFQSPGFQISWLKAQPIRIRLDGSHFPVRISILHLRFAVFVPVTVSNQLCDIFPHFIYLLLSFKGNVVIGISHLHELLKMQRYEIMSIRPFMALCQPKGRARNESFCISLAAGQVLLHCGKLISLPHNLSQILLSSK